MPNKANTRQHIKHKTAYETQARRTEQNRLRRLKRRERGRANAVPKEKAPPVQREESLNERQERHEQHQAMLSEHIRLAEAARERHRHHWHRYKPIPITLI